MGKAVDYRMLIDHKGVLRKLGTIIIHRFEGDVFYVPSQKKATASNYGVEGGVIDHVAWHKTGRVHMKFMDGSRKVFEHGQGETVDASGKRQPIENIGYQEVIWDTVMSMESLPILSKGVGKLDGVFQVGDYDGPVQFRFSIISGRQIIKATQGEKTPVKPLSEASRAVLLDSTLRALGHESGNADKLLQYMLCKFTGTDLEKGRRIFVPVDSKIARD